MAKLVCPVCGKSRELFEKPEKWLPFCSPRCKQVDLGKWLMGQYEVSSPLGPENLSDHSDHTQRDTND